MVFTPAWMNAPQHQSEEKKKHVSLDGITLDKLDKIVDKVALSNADRQAAAIEKADSYSFQVANPWFRQTDANMKIVNKWLTSKGIRYATYPEIAEAVEDLAQAGLVSVDDAAYASHLDGNDLKTFKGALTCKTYDSHDALISNERAASIRMLGAEQKSDEELAFDALPAEQQRQMLLDAQRTHQANADAATSTQAADSWVSLHEEYRDDERNGKLLLAQMRHNQKGTVTHPFTIEEHEIANRQLVATGLLRQNPKALQKQEAQAVLDRAQAAKNEHGSIFDTTSIEEMEEMPLDELRRRADKQLASRR